MNVFFSSLSPYSCAQNVNFHAKLRNKLILESVQLLFNAARAHGFDVPYKPSYTKHECSLWLLQDYSNFYWLTDHLHALHELYVKDSKKQHKSFTTFNAWYIDNIVDLANTYPVRKLTVPYLAFSEGNEDLERQYGHYVPNPNDKKTPYAVANSFSDATLAYQEYLRRKPYAQGKFLNFI